jgi:hypothetical protein
VEPTLFFLASLLLVEAEQLVGMLLLMVRLHILAALVAVAAMHYQHPTALKWARLELLGRVLRVATVVFMMLRTKLAVAVVARQRLAAPEIHKDQSKTAVMAAQALIGCL